MTPPVSRREFMTASALAAGAVGLTGAGAAQAPAPAPQGRGGPQAQAPPVSSLDFKTKPRKALIARPSEDDLKRLKDAGFDGVEGSREVTPEEAASTRAIADKLGMRVHSVLYGWAEFNSPDPKEAERTFAETEAALRTAAAFGADAVLLVPCRIGPRGGRGAGAPAAAMRMPRPWEFQIEFDDRTGHLTKVVYGDNTPYAEYIAAHNHATDTSAVWVKRLIPLAEKLKVVIALENVSNNLWVKPAVFGHFVRSFRSPWVKAYFDIGNHVRFAPPEEWILTLGDVLAKIHVKDYKLNRSDPDGRGTSVNIREGDVRWPVLRQALEVVNYNGWMTIESNGSIPIEERSRRLDLILAGE
jgi:hexulose-6-phosphate isomerase